MSARARPSPMWRWVKILATRGAYLNIGLFGLGCITLLVGLPHWFHGWSNFIFIGSWLLASLGSFYLFYELNAAVERIVRRARESDYSTSGTTADILYLRPFKIDTWPAGVAHSFEEILFTQLAERIVTVSDPKPTASGFGDVPRLRLPAGEAPGRDWEFYVARLIEESRIVVLVCHWGSAGDWGAAGFHRELEIIAEQKAVEKTIFITYILDHLGWASLLASLDDKQLRACLEAAPVSDAIVNSLVELMTEQMKSVKFVSDRMPRFDWSHADPLKVKFNGVALTSQDIQVFRATTEKAIALAERPEWGIMLPSALLLQACDVPADCIIMIHSLINNGTVGLTFRNGLRLWTSSRIGEARIQKQHQTLLQAVWSVLTLLVSGRAQLEETRELAGLLDQMVRHISADGSVA